MRQTSLSITEQHMTAPSTKGRVLHVAATGKVGGAATAVYRMIADYRNGHTRIIPPRYFRNLAVDVGGYGAGTLIRYDMLAFGRTVHARARVTEPEPGRRLVETDLDKGAVTTFVVDSLGGRSSLVTIATDIPVRGGLLGGLERFMLRSFLKRVYAAELSQIDQEVRIGG
jgi:hypothetical protein